MSNDLTARFLEHLRGSHLFPEAGRAMLAVSGGPDSVAMLGLFLRVMHRIPLEIVVAHVDHGIHPDSEMVARNVARMAELAGVQGFSERIELGPAASETTARHARYDCLNKLCVGAGARYLVTAHHADDQVETVFLRFLQGSGMAGLAGIAPSNDAGLVRPLLPFRRADIADWARSDRRTASFLQFAHDDPANQDLRHDRSWMRHSLLPQVQKRLGHAADQGLLRIAVNSRNERMAWRAVLRVLPDLNFAVVDDTVQVARQTLQGYDPKLSSALLCAAGREVGCVIGPERARRVLPSLLAAPSGRTFQLGKGWVIDTTFDRLEIRRLENSETDERLPSSVAWGETLEGTAQFGEWTVSWGPGRAGRLDRQAMVTWVTEGGGIIRTPRAGDRVRPLGGVGRRKVSRLLMEGKVPRSARSDYPILEKGDHIVWLPGICRADLDVPTPGQAAIRVDAQHCGR